jgi:hypothetical protein
MENSAKEKVNTEKQTEKETPVPVNPLDLITGKWTLKPCRRTWLHAQNPDHDGADIFSGAQIWIGASRSLSNPDIVITGLTEPERIAFETAMFLQPGTLSPYNRKFWADKNQYIKVGKKGVDLDCDNNIKHKLWYKLAMASKKVAKGKEDLSLNSTADVLLTSLEQEAKVDSHKINAKSKAYVKFSAMSLGDKINYLKVYDEGQFKVNASTKPDLIDQAIGTIIERSPDEFLSTFDNPYYKDYIFLEDLLSKNIISRKGGKYFITGGVEIGTSKAQVVKNLISDDFQDTKVGLLAKLEASK